MSSIKIPVYPYVEENLLKDYLINRGESSCFFIYLQFGDFVFPNKGSIDFAIRILGWWIFEFNSLLHGKNKIFNDFMEGDFEFHIQFVDPSDEANLNLLIEFYIDGKKLNQTQCVSALDYAKSLSSAVKNIEQIFLKNEQETDFISPSKRYLNDIITALNERNS